MKTNEVNYYKCEYENIRRKKNLQINKMQLQQAMFAKKTYELLKGLGLSDNDIFIYYKNCNQE